MEKFGVFFCSGCEIGSTEGLDVDGLADEAKSELKAKLCEQHGILCSAEGVELIKKSIADNELDSVAIAACSGRVKQAEFDFGPNMVVERINLRELCAWSFKEAEEVDDDADETNIQMLALDNLRMGLTKLQKTKPIEPFSAEEFYKSVLVVGGGVTGMNAALNVAKAGYEAVLVEKDKSLGGLMGKLHMEYPTEMPFAELKESTIPALIKAVEGQKGIKVHTSTEVEKVAGGPGLFDVTLKSNGSSVTENVGAIVLATGATPYDPTKLDHLGYGKSDKVITSMDLEEMAAAGKLKGVGSVAFIQCAGSRDPDHLLYCSSHCCMTSLKQALYLREQNAEAKAYIFYKDMRTPGHYEEFYRRAQDDEGVFLTKGDVVSVEPKGKSVIVEVDNTLLGEKVSVEADLVVLATGLVPSTKTGNKDFDNTLFQKVVADADDKNKKDEGEEEEKSTRPPSKALHLEYRQGPELPNLRFGFPDSHFICFPYETRRTGIFAAGSVRSPMDSNKAADDAAGAALKAIQCVEMTSRGEAVHPRAGDQSYPEFNMSRCTQCKRCTEECPFGAINEDEKANPLPQPTRCRRCGTCMGACPERIISFKNYSIDMIGSMIKSLEVPDEFEEKPRILVMACENDALPALELAAMHRMKYSPWVRFISLRCLGSLNLVWIADSLSRGIDGIMLLGCKHGDDYQCHFVKGSELCSVRLSKISETLQRLALDSERIRMEQVQLSDYMKLPALIDSFAEEIAELEPNPYKGM